MKLSYSASLLIMAISLLTACQTAETKDEPAAQAPQELPIIAEAKAAFEAVDALGNAWRDTEEMIQEAEKAAQAGDSDTATKLAKAAIEESRLATEQYESQKNAAPQ